MLIAILTASVTLAHVPAEISRPVELEAIGGGIVVQASATHFVAKNESRLPHLMLVGSLEFGLVSSVALCPSQRLVYAIPRGTLEGLCVEFLSNDRGLLRNSGALALDELLESDDLALWTVTSEGHMSAWRRSSGELEHVAPRGGLLPANLASPSSLGLYDYGSETSPTIHVPGVTPPDAKDEGDPPVVRDKPLPPV